MFQGKALTHRMCCAIIVVKTARAPFEPTEYRQIASSTINTKAQLNTQLKYRNTIQVLKLNVMELVSVSSQISVCEERARRINTLSHPPTSSGRRPSSVVLSDGAQAQRAQRGEEQEEQEEEGEGEWKLRQPFYRAAWKQAEMLSQECKSTV